jgi:hypothetical protein
MTWEFFTDDECIEVRASRFFYFDENPGGRSIAGRISRLKAEEAAKACAELMRDDHD